jgi:hypothetical protein
MPDLTDALAGLVHFLELAPHFLGDALGFGAVGFAEGVGGGQAIAQRGGSGFGERDPLDEGGDGLNEIALLGKKL